MRRRPFRRGLLLTGAVAAVMAACGMKGPPLPPIAIVSTGITDLAARRLGADVYLQFTIPVRNVTGEAPADIERVELYGFTGEPFEFPNTPLDDEDFLDYATLIQSVDVRPPPEPIEPGEAGLPPPVPEPAGPPDDRPGQGDILTLLEVLTPEVFVPVDLEHDRDEAEEEVAPIWIPALWPTSDPRLTRYYTVVARNHRNQPSAATTRVRVPLDPPPPPPASLTVQYGEDEIELSWLEPPLAPRLVQEPVTPATTAAATAAAAAGGPPVVPPLRSTPIAPERALYAYNVYDPRAIPNADGRVAPINEAPLEVLTFTDDRLEFGVQRCYVVMTVQRYGPLSVESDQSETVCVTPMDSFRPAAPTRLVSVGSSGVISLLWDANDEEDLAGYIVLRGEAPGDTLQPITPDPIEEPTYRDTAITPGVRYVYAVLAVDTAANVSLESNRVEETAR